jgi:hypothetical protein
VAGDGALVETITDERTGKSAQLRLDKRAMMFSCRIGEDHLSSGDGHEVRRWAKERLALSDAITWEPVLRVTVSEGSLSYGFRHRRDDGVPTEASVEVSVHRFYIGRTEGGKWFRTAWETRDADSPKYLPDETVIAKADAFSTGNTYEDPNSYDNKRRASTAPLPRFRVPYAEGNVTLLPYDEEAYLGALRIIANIEQTRVDLVRLVATRKGIDALRSIARGETPKQLAAGPAHAPKKKTTRTRR